MEKLKATLIKKYKPKTVYPQSYHSKLIALLKKKSTTVHVLESADYNDGLTSSVTFKVYFK